MFVLISNNERELFLKRLQSTAVRVLRKFSEENYADFLKITRVSSYPQLN